MKKIKVLHLITKLEFGGAQQNTLYTVGHLNPQQFEIILAGGPGGFLDKEALLLPRHAGIFWLRYLKRPIRPWWDILALLELWLLLVKLKPHIIHTHSSKAGIIGRWAAKLAGIPVIIHTYHGFGFHEHQNPIVRLVLAFIEKLSAKITTQLVYVSRSNMAYAQKWKIQAHNPPVLIRSGVDLNYLDRLTTALRRQKRQELNIAPEAIVVTTIGNLKPQKNPLDFLAVARDLENQAPQAVFLFVGGTESSSSLAPLFTNEKTPKNLRFLGWRQDAREILNASDIFVLTSLWEGLPRSLVEALRLGLASCAYAADGIAEIIRHGENGLLAAPGCRRELSRQLLSLITDAKLRHNLALKAKETIKQEFDIKDMLNQQEKLYQALIFKHHVDV